MTVYLPSCHNLVVAEFKIHSFILQKRKRIFLCQHKNRPSTYLSEITTHLQKGERIIHYDCKIHTHKLTHTLEYIQINCIALFDKMKRYYILKLCPDSQKHDHFTSEIIFVDSFETPTGTSAFNLEK